MTTVIRNIKNGDTILRQIVTQNDRGPRGEKGDTGERGPDGPQGQPGQDGQRGRDGVIQYRPGVGIEISSDNIISTSGLASAAWGTLTGNMADQTDLNNALTGITSKIPEQASVQNQLADKNFVNSSINSVTAYYITRNTAGDPFATKAQLLATTTFYSGGEVRIPKRNDYCVVLEDESQRDPITEQDPTVRYIYQNGWQFQYIVNKTSLTAAQLAAINSGITAAGVQKLDNLATVATTGSYTDLSNKPTIPVITMTTTDPGEGAALAANNFIAVYSA